MIAYVVFVGVCFLYTSGVHTIKYLFWIVY